MCGRLVEPDDGRYKGLVSFARVWAARTGKPADSRLPRFSRARVDGSYRASFLPPGRSYLGADQIKHEREEHNPDKHDRQQRNENAK